MEAEFFNKKAKVCWTAAKFCKKVGNAIREGDDDGDKKVQKTFEVSYSYPIKINVCVCVCRVSPPRNFGYPRRI